MFSSSTMNPPPTHTHTQHTHMHTSVQVEALKERVADEKREEESWRREFKEIEGGSGSGDCTATTTVLATSISSDSLSPSWTL